MKGEGNLQKGPDTPLLLLRLSLLSVVLLALRIITKTKDVGLKDHIYRSFWDLTR